VSAPRYLPAPTDPANEVWAASQVRAAMLLMKVAREFRLSAREQKVLEAAAQGQASKEIAFNLEISRRTVDYHWRQIFQKLRCRSQLEAISLLFRRALENGHA
jgi:DNA-binding NarL/FixJ family response regulator